MTRRSATCQRGLTLVEMMVVIILAGIVILGLTGFYFNAQSVWLDGSSQAITQREATLVVEVMRDSVNRAANAIVSQADQLELFDELDGPLFAVWLDPADSLLHFGRDIGDDRGPLIRSRVARFEVADRDSLIELTMLQLHTGTGNLVQVTSAFVMMNQAP